MIQTNGQESMKQRKCKTKKKKKWSVSQCTSSQRERSSDTSCFQLTSILLSRDPALLRRPRLPARDMQYQRLEIDSTSWIDYRRSGRPKSEEGVGGVLGEGGAVDSDGELDPNTKDSGGVERGTFRSQRKVGGR